jgi:hypothetical protein
MVKISQTAGASGLKYGNGFAVRKDRGSLKGKENDVPRLVFPISDIFKG